MKKGRRWTVSIAAVLLLGGGGYLLSQRPPGGSSSTGSSSSGGKGGRRGAGGPTPVSVAKVTRGNIGVYINALGTVTPVYTVTVASRVAGELVDVRYHEGQIVQKGDILATIDPRPYQATVTQAEGQLQRDQALLKNALLDLSRYQTVFAQHAIPEQTVATQEATVEQDRGTVKVDQGNLDAAQVNLDYSTIRSPITGRVGLRTVDPGNIVPANGATGIATITQLQPITVIFTMAEDYIDQVVAQMRVGHKLAVEALDRSSENLIATGTVLTLDNQIDLTSGTVRVRATFANPHNELFPNEFVNAKLLVKTLMGVNLIPTAAIQRNNDVAYVYVVNPQSSVVQSRNIQIANTSGNVAAVTGVTVGETLVTDGFDRLTDGAKVAIRARSQGSAAVSSTATEQSQNDTAQSQSNTSTATPRQHHQKSSQDSAK